MDRETQVAAMSDAEIIEWAVAKQIRAEETAATRSFQRDARRAELNELYADPQTVRLHRRMFVEELQSMDRLYYSLNQGRAPS